MDMRAEVYSPLQNLSIWLGSWLYGLEATDELLDVAYELNYELNIDHLSQIRAFTDLTSAGPALRLILTGPGESAGVPVGQGGTIAFRGSQSSLLLIDDHLVLHEAALPAQAWLSPGEADQLLSQAMLQAADLIEAEGYTTDALNNPRLTVGTLADFYETPGLPGATPPRAAKLIARADRAAAIVETVTARMGDHSLDPQLLSLWRHIRQARMTAVSYALVEFSRG